MNLLDALRGLVRRWYVVVPGLLIAVAASAFVWVNTPPDYERKASQLLLPGEGVLPEGATNQYLYMGGLGPVADVLTRAVDGDEQVQAFREEGVEITIGRDGSASGPLVLITVTAGSDTDATTILDAVAAQTGITLDQLQAEQGVPRQDRVTLSTIAMEQQSTIIQRSRLIATGTVGAGIALAALVGASTLDGLMTRRRRHPVVVDDDIDDVDPAEGTAADPTVSDAEVGEELGAERGGELEPVRVRRSTGDDPDVRPETPDEESTDTVEQGSVEQEPADRDATDRDEAVEEQPARDAVTDSAEPGAPTGAEAGTGFGEPVLASAAGPRGGRDKPRERRKPRR